MKTKVIWVIAIVIGLISGGGAIWAWRSGHTNSLAAERAASATITELPTNTSSASSNASSSLLAPSSNSGTPLSTQQPQQQTPTPTNSNAPSTSNTGTANANPSNNPGDKATLDPTQFAAYDKYKDEQDAKIGDAKYGTGAEAVPGKTVSVNYRGWLTSGKVFDENIRTSTPFNFTLGQNSVIKGWEEGIPGMKVGGERLVIVPPAAGYGTTGNSTIPPNAVLVFYVKLLAVQ